MPHTNRGLLDHLLGTRQLLVEWEARPALCDAGLFHSVYGTEYYELKAIPLTMRHEVRQLIGEEAESLAWLFCMIRRESLYENPGQDGGFRVQHRVTDEWLPLTGIQFQDLLTLTIANVLEPFPRCSWMARRHLRRGLGRIGTSLFTGPKGDRDRIDVIGGNLEMRNDGMERRSNPGRGTTVSVKLTNRWPVRRSLRRSKRLR